MTEPESIKGEFEFINWLRQRTAKLPGQGIKIGIGDDMAQVQLPGQEVLVCCDMILDGVHFDSGKHSYRQIGYKALACNLSDCAAMAARPIAALISVVLPEQIDMDRAKELYLGMEGLCRQFNCPIIGGDTTSWSGKLAIDVTVLALAGKSGPIRRQGARIGDLIFVTGKLGGSILGKNMDFEPRIDHACWLGENWSVHAMIDISDGLAADLKHICDESGVGAVLEQQLLDGAVSAAAVQLADQEGSCGQDGQDGRNALEHALYDGEDYELIVVCDPKLSMERIPPLDLVLIPIGRIGSKQGIWLEGIDGRTVELHVHGYEHFR